MHAEPILQARIFNNTHSPGYSKTPVSEKTILIYLYICQLKSSASKQTITAVTAVGNISVFVYVEMETSTSKRVRVLL